MSSATPFTFTAPIVLNMRAALSKLSESEFQELCEQNPDWRLERTKNGELVIMPPTGGSTGRQSLRLAAQLSNWCERDGTGVGFDSSTGFSLPNGAKRSPDAAWVSNSRWDRLSDEQKDAFPPLAPDFVAELRSKTDSLDDLRAKMQEYVENGVRLGWLIDPTKKTVEIYRPGQPVSILSTPSSITGDPELPGFILDLTRIW